jgi:hypothetical protein
MKTNVVAFILLALSSSLGAEELQEPSLETSSSEVSVGLDVQVGPGPDGYYYPDNSYYSDGYYDGDNVIWVGPGWYGGYWFGTEGDFNDYHRGHGHDGHGGWGGGHGGGSMQHHGGGHGGGHK